jgi:hypothetical protein
MHTLNLLSSFPVARTSDPEEVRALFARVYGRPVMDFTGQDRKLLTVVNHCKLQHIELNYATYGGELYLQYPDSEFVSQVFSIKGKGEAVIGGNRFQSVIARAPWYRAICPLASKSMLSTSAWPCACGPAR